MPMTKWVLMVVFALAIGVFAGLCGKVLGATTHVSVWMALGGFVGFVIQTLVVHLAKWVAMRHC